MKLSKIVLLLSAFSVAPALMASSLGVTNNPTIDIWWSNGTIQNPPQVYVGQVQFEVDEEGNFFVAGSTAAPNASCAQPDPNQAASFCWGADQDQINIGNLTYGNLDPYFTFAASAIDFGAASIFTYVFSSPIVPTITGKASYYLDIGGSVSSTAGSPGGSLGVAAPNTLGIVEGLVNGTTVIAGTGPPLIFGGPGTVSYGTHATSGTFDCSTVGGCTSFQAQLSFLGSGGADAYGFTGYYEIQAVPVPAAVWMFGSALGLLGAIRRRAAR